MKMPGFLLQHTVQVAQYLGSSSKGDLYAAAEPVPCLLDERTQMVTNPAGQTVTSSSSYIAPRSHNPSPKSRVTLPDGRVTTVITVARPDGGALPVPSNTQVFLQ